MNVNEIFQSFPEKIKLAFFRQFNEYYKLSQTHTIAVLPFWGLFCRYGNEVRPLLNLTEMNTLCFMTNGFGGHFKDTIVYPGANIRIASDPNELSDWAKSQSKQQYILSRIFNKFLWFKKPDIKIVEYKEILEEYKTFLENFDEMYERYPLPYKTAFDIKDTDELINYLNHLYYQSKKSDELTRLLLVYPTESCFIQPLDYEKVTNFMSGINGTLYLGHSCADQYLDKLSPAFTAEGAFNNPIVHCLQDFATTYNSQIAQEAGEAFSFEIEKIYKAINDNGILNIQNDVLSEIYQIDTAKVYMKHNSTPHKSYKKIQKQ